MKAIVHEGQPGFSGLKFAEIPSPAVKPGTVKVRLKTAGLNHRDLFTLVRHKADAGPLVIGSDGAGIVEEIGEGVSGFQKGDEVVIIPSLGWRKKSAAPPEGFEILGLPDDGTFAEEIVVPAENLAPKPHHLSWEQAGVVMLGALTAYRALVTRAHVAAGQTVLIPGVGGGVATLLIQMAKALGAKVIVTSRSSDKREKALALGADRAIDSNGDWQEALPGEKVDVVIESVGAATFEKSLSLLKPGGIIVVFGASAGDVVPLNLRNFFYGQYTLIGSTMGSIEEAHECLRFMEEHRIAPVIDSVFPLREAEAALRKLERGEQFGKIALKIAD
ncbi:zinc-binding dehydrogenase [Caenibacillus caldisaponilyticus]|uniref:zinc-binding dehydrogenase n=1 Tax=Caenibacillus caldisaponilyticus TaxID=1674942 RepID=UPI0009883001|nr:zinc-binding dehydrogenase [Caenibacillus caldisaponilyticus]